MNKIGKWLSLLLCCVAALYFATACVSSEEGGGNEEEPVITEKVIIPLAFDNMDETEDLQKFISEVDNSDGSHNNEMKETGSVISPYFSMKAEDKNVDCYAVRTALGAHSFAMVDVGAKSFPFEVTIDLLYGAENVNVLPQKYGVTAR